MGRSLFIAFFALRAAAAEPSALTVPSSLGKLELSDVVWASTLSRYVLVTDESPFLVTMTVDGALDEAPLRIAGVDSLHDAEALANGPEGTLLLSTSHAPNKKGALKASRRQVLWLALEHGALTVKGRLDLTTVRDPTGRSLQELASGRAADSLDVEALAFHDGALLVGLKAPLAAGGRAVLVKLANITQAFKVGSVSPKDVSVFARPELKVSSVAQGISALLRLDDGRWLIGANAPKGGPSDGGGALWLFDGKTATLLAHFEHLKPEGVTLAADGQSVIVVFDEGGATPKWLRLPVPR